MTFDKVHFRRCLLYEFQQGHTAADAWRNITNVFGQEKLSKRTCSHWFSRLRSGNFSLDDEEREGRPPFMDVDRLISLTESDSSLTTREPADLLGCCKSTVANHLLQLRFRSKIGRWVPHRLTETHKQMRVDICTHLLLIEPQKTVLCQIVTGDEKWILYYNHRRTRHEVQYEADPSPEPKADLHPKKAHDVSFLGRRGNVIS